MVRAILNGTKTQTRRVLRWPDWINHNRDAFAAELGKGHRIGQFKDGRVIRSMAPLYAPGDRLWVRETWKVGSWTNDGRFAIDYAAGPGGKTPWLRPPDVVGAKLAEESLHDCDRYMEAHDDDDDCRVQDEGARYTWEVGNSPCRWRPPIHMPRWASRITLEITDVRVERLQDITEEDARAEGVKASSVPGDLNHRGRFRQLWDDLYAVPEIPSPTAAKKRPGCSWADNPWVWAVSFRRVEVAGG